MLTICYEFSCPFIYTGQDLMRLIQRSTLEESTSSYRLLLVIFRAFERCHPRVLEARRERARLSHPISLNQSSQSLHQRRQMTATPPRKQREKKRKTTQNNKKQTKKKEKHSLPSLNSKIYKIMRKRGEEQFLLFSTIFCYLLLEIIDNES